MQQYDKVNSCESEAVESDWLDVSYTKRKYIDEEQPFTNKRPTLPKIRKYAKYVGAVVLTLTAFVGMLFASAEDSVLATAKLAYTSSLTQSVSLFERKDSSKEVKLPATTCVVNVGDDGTVTLGGGRIATCLVGGEVVSVTDTAVTVAVDEQTNMVYSSLTQTLVQVGDILQRYDCIGKYEGTTCVNVLFCDEAVTNVVGSTYSFSWEG